MRSASAIAFDYAPSRRLAAGLVAMTAAGAVAPWLSALPAPAAIAVSALVMLAGLGARARFVAPAFRRIAWRASGWTLVDADGVEHAATLRSHARLGTWLALELDVAGRRRFRAVLGPGNSDAETRRRLILLLARAEVAHAG